MPAPDADHELERELDPGPILTTARLRLRPWCDADLAPFAAMSADPRVMEHMPGLLDQPASDDLAGKIRGHFAARGFGLWALEVAGGPPFIGFTGLSIPPFDAPFTPCVELGYRLAADQWGLGYASEAAAAAIAFGFDVLDLDAIVAFTTPANRRSRRAMERLGMTHDPADDFDHPRLPAEHRLARHVLYRLRRPPRAVHSAHAQATPRR